MVSLGAVQRTVGDEEYAEEEEQRMHVQVHHILPPFLDGAACC